MKNSNTLSLVICIGILIAVGCSCPKMAELQKELDKGSKTTPSPTISSNSNISDTGDAETSDLTLAKYNQLKNGMSLKEVQDVIGSDGKEMSSSEIGKSKTITQKWDGDNYSYIICTFQNDKLLFKSQSSLK